MKKVLMIAYYFPPLGGAGVRRILNFVKYLPAFGWQPTVVSVSNNKYYIKDHTLLNEIDSKIKVLRFSAFEFMNYYHKSKKYGLHKIVSLLDKLTGFPDSQVFWYINVIRKLPKIVDIYQFDTIYATFGPGSNLLVGKHLAKRYSKPLVVDFRDEWANNPQLTSNIWLKSKRPFFKILEKTVIKRSDRVICLNEVMRNNFIEFYHKEKKSKFVIIPNGYDYNNLKNKLYDTNNPFNNEVLNIVYAGSFYGYQQPDYFLMALKDFILENHEGKSKIRVHFIGNVKTPVLLNLLKDNLLKSVVILMPYLSLNKLQNYLNNADILLLIIGNAPGAEVIYTSKLFEYLGLGKPILAVVPINGVAAELIRKTESGFIANNSDISSIKETISKIFMLWKERKLNVNQDKKEILKYSIENLTKKLVKIFELVSNKSNI